MSGFVYFVSDGKLVKIGFSKRPEKRLGSMRTMSSVTLQTLGIVPGSRALEQATHQVLAKHRHHGEWFVNCPDVLNLIARIITDGFEAAGVVPEPAAEEFDEHTSTAIRCARIIAKYAFGRSLDELAKLYGIRPKLLWSMIYRPSRVYAHDYFALMSAALKVVDDARDAATADRNNIAELIDRHGSETDLGAFLDAELARLERALAGGRLQ